MPSSLLLLLLPGIPKSLMNKESCQKLMHVSAWANLGGCKDIVIWQLLFEVGVVQHISH